VHFPNRRRHIALGYNSVRSSGLDRLMRERLAPERFRLGRAVMEIGTGHVLLEGGERIEADGVIDARGPAPTPGLELAWQKFVGRTVRFAKPHGETLPVIMDATVDQSDGYRFVYTLPFDEREMMVEDTYYSSSPALNVAGIGRLLDDYVAAKGWAVEEIIEEETGVLPVLVEGEIEALWPATDPPVARLGLRGGFFHPTTGYSLPDAVRNAALLVTQTDLGTAALHAFYRARAAQLWSERNFFQLLNRMLFRAAEPPERYRVLEHFYRLPPATIARFYGARLSTLDKLRVVTGRPPVPFGRAIRALSGGMR
jgi:lycopene beta-cyclase